MSATPPVPTKTSSPKYRVGGSRKHLSTGTHDTSNANKPNSSPTPSQYSPSALPAVSSLTTNNKKPQQQGTSLAIEPSPSPVSFATAIVPSSPSSSKHHVNKFAFTKQGTEVGKTLSFESGDMLSRRRMMCARRGELGAELVICGGKSLLDEGETFSSTGAFYGSANTYFNNTNNNNNNNNNNSRSPQRRNIDSNFVDNNRDDDNNYNTASTSPAPQFANFASLFGPDAPSPLNRFFGTKLPSIHDKHNNSPSANDAVKNKDSGAMKKKKIKKYSDEDTDSDEENEEAEEEEEDSAAAIAKMPVNMALPDWRMLLGKELYAKEKDKLDIIKDRYSVATNPNQGKGAAGSRRRKSMTGSGNNNNNNMEASLNANNRNPSSSMRGGSTVLPSSAKR